MPFLYNGLTMLTCLLSGLILFGQKSPSIETPVSVQAGPFRPTMESLKGYTYPEWFRDAKFGIWAHWGPQAVPMEGDWYARQMYEEGSKDYKDHLARFGHPSQHGYKDIIPLWKAEKWDPDRLMTLYKKAGAKYFVSMGTHHDNFFLWKSKLHRWNSVEMGPHRDVVADWQRAARKQGLKFGVSEHLAASFTWFQKSHGSDKTGPFAGVPYDGANPAYQDLYHFPAEPGDTGWNSNNPKFQRQWFNEIRELVDNYHPDLLYSDSGVPFGNEVGLSLISHFYNTNAARHGGKVQAVYNCKQPSDGRWVQDIERGIQPKIDPNPWQTDTSIGDWFYNRNWKFQPPTWVIHRLVDNVSKNGNLLLNVVQRPDGSLDPEVESLLGELATWNKIHGEAIFGTRPWTVYGESKVKVRGGAFNEAYSYTSRDIRFTTKGPVLYATALGWPEDRILHIRSLALKPGESINQIRSIKLLGSKAPVTWRQTADELEVVLPPTPVSVYTASLKVTGKNLQAVPIVDVVPPIVADKDGNFTLDADSAELHGAGIRVESRDGQANVGYWDNSDEWVSWKFNVPAAGKYAVEISTATVNDGGKYIVSVGGKTVSGAVANTGDWGKFALSQPGLIDLPAGSVTVEFRPKSAAEWKPTNLRWVKLKPGNAGASPASGKIP